MARASKNILRTDVLLPSEGISTKPRGDSRPRLSGGATLRYLSCRQNPVEPCSTGQPRAAVPTRPEASPGFEKKNGWVGSRCAEQSDLEGRQTRPIPA